MPARQATLIAIRQRELHTFQGTNLHSLFPAHFLPAAALFVVGYTGCDPAAPAALFVAAVMVSSALAAGAYASALEIAPNFAGTSRGSEVIRV